MKRGLAAALIAALIAACVPAQRTLAPSAYVERREALSALPVWSLAGRVGVRLEQRGFTGSLNWRQTGETIDARFHGPLGAGAFRVSGNGERLLLETGDGERYMLDDPVRDLDAQLGWSVPVHALRYWLLGLPYPQWEAIEQLDDSGRLARLEQLDWIISYDRYTAVDNWLMPRKLVIDGSDVNVRLAIHTWSLGTQIDTPAPRTGQ